MIAIKKVAFFDSAIGIELMKYYKFKNIEEKIKIENKIKEIIEKNFGISTKDKIVIFTKLPKGTIFYKVIE